MILWSEVDDENPYESEEEEEVSFGEFVMEDAEAAVPAAKPVAKGRKGAKLNQAGRGAT